MSDLSKEFLSSKEFAKKAGVSLRTVRDWVKKGKVTPFPIRGQRGKTEHRFPPDEVKKIRRNGEANVASLEMNSERQNMVRVFTAASTQKELQQANYRIGWLEGQLELHRKMLTDGQDAARIRDEEMRSAIKKSEEKNEEARRLTEELERVCQEKEALAVRVKELERPWWQRLFGLR